MLLAIDIGNSRIKFGVFEDDNLVSKISIPTKRDFTAGELGGLVGNPIGMKFEAAIACSVVPQVNDGVREHVLESLGVETTFVDSTFDFGLVVKYETITTLGVDRLVNASAAVHKYGRPCIVCSLGTATTIDVVNAADEFLGGAIAPGMQMMADALNQNTAQLPRIDLAKPKSVIGKSTVESLRSGVFFGYVGLVEKLIDKTCAALGERPVVVATGGFSETVSTETTAIDEVEAHLTLLGLNNVARDAA
ncbi:MAG: type III pantothenate kinase [Pyrinomonadaceae bacterium]